MELSFLLLVLVCPVVMGAMMWFMMRGNSAKPNASADQEQELAKLRAEIAALRPAPAAFDERHPAPASHADKHTSA